MIGFRLSVSELQKNAFVSGSMIAVCTPLIIVLSAPASLYKKEHLYQFPVIPAGIRHIVRIQNLDAYNDIHERSAFVYCEVLMRDDAFSGTDLHKYWTRLS